MTFKMCSGPNEPRNKLKQHTLLLVFFSHILCLVFKCTKIIISLLHHQSTRTHTHKHTSATETHGNIYFVPLYIYSQSPPIRRRRGGSPVHVGGAFSYVRIQRQTRRKLRLLFFKSRRVHEQHWLKKGGGFKCQNQSGSSGPKSTAQELSPLLYHFWPQDGPPPL